MCYLDTVSVSLCIPLNLSEYNKQPLINTEIRNLNPTTNIIKSFDIIVFNVIKWFNKRGKSRRSTRFRMCALAVVCSRCIYLELRMYNRQEVSIFMNRKKSTSHNKKSTQRSIYVLGWPRIGIYSINKEERKKKRYIHMKKCQFVHTIPTHW